MNRVFCREVLECGEFSPLSRGDSSPSNVLTREVLRGAWEQLAWLGCIHVCKDVGASGLLADSTATSRLHKAVTSHRTPRRWRVVHGPNGRLVTGTRAGRRERRLEIEDC